MAEPGKDPLEVVRKAMQLAEHCAEIEARKGEQADLNYISENMLRAATLARSVNEIEATRGIVRGVPGGGDPALAKLSDEELDLFMSLSAAMDGRPDPHHHLLRLSWLRRRVGMLEQANERLLGELRELKFRGSPAGGHVPAGVGGGSSVAARDGSPPGSSSSDVQQADNVVPITDNGLPGKHNRMRAQEPQRRAPDELRQGLAEV